MRSVVILLLLMAAPAVAQDVSDELVQRVVLARQVAELRLSVNEIGAVEATMAWTGPATGTVIDKYIVVMTLVIDPSDEPVVVANAYRHEFNLVFPKQTVFGQFTVAAEDTSGRLGPAAISNEWIPEGGGSE